jgi:cell division protein FtsI/penicillin-binding protein 2
MRVSVVVLDAENGDLLASANYPLPDYEQIKSDIENRSTYYSDNYKDAHWKAYTDRDLGTTWQTEPGSTAKVMSATAGFMKYGLDIAKQTYKITKENRIENKVHKEPIGNRFPMDSAIIKSSNCYFVNLVNDKDLYGQLDTVYYTIGVRIGDITPYYYTMRDTSFWKERYEDKIQRNQKSALFKYEQFKTGELPDPKEKRIVRKPQDKTNMSIPDWKWAWGQGFSDPGTGESFDMKATPLNMARMVSAVVNEGVMPTTQYVMDSALRHDSTIRLLESNEASKIKGYMIAETKWHQKHRSWVDFGSALGKVGGKTGTPVRWRYLPEGSDEEKEDLDDGWYVFFVEGDDLHSLAVVVRIERGVGSSEAVKMSKEVVLPILKEKNYCSY